MHMTFWWDFNVSSYLFKGLSSHSIGGLLGMCLCVASMSFAFEFLRYIQAKQRQKELSLRSQQLRTICPTDTSMLLRGEEAPLRPTINITRLNRTCLGSADLSLWFALQNLGYILMLTVMVYNGWLFVSAVFGGGLGYFVFGQGFMKINLQNCQIIRDTWCMQHCGEPEAASASRDGESTPALEASTSRSALSSHEVVANVHVECHT